MHSLQKNGWMNAFIAIECSSFSWPQSGNILFENDQNGRFQHVGNIISVDECNQFQLY